jgi:serine/threonine protein kinase HipA of HipAB toxin-antitoxin module
VLAACSRVMRRPGEPRCCARIESVPTRARSWQSGLFGCGCPPAGRRHSGADKTIDPPDTRKLLRDLADLPPSLRTAGQGAFGMAIVTRGTMDVDLPPPS